MSVLVQVRHEDEHGWHSSISVRPGDEVEVYLRVANDGQARLNGVTARFSLAPGLSFMGGSARQIIGHTTTQHASNNLVAGGLRYTYLDAHSSVYTLIHAIVTGVHAPPASLWTVGVGGSDQLGQVWDVMQVRLSDS